jgi:hypothetical protein
MAEKLDKLRKAVRVGKELKEHLERVGKNEAALSVGGDLLVPDGALDRYLTFERFAAAILASQNSVQDPEAAADFAGRRALEMLRWIDEHEDEILNLP